MRETVELPKSFREASKREACKGRTIIQVARAKRRPRLFCRISNWLERQRKLVANPQYSLFIGWRYMVHKRDSVWFSLQVNPREHMFLLSSFSFYPPTSVPGLFWNLCLALKTYWELDKTSYFYVKKTSVAYE